MLFKRVINFPEFTLKTHYNEFENLRRQMNHLSNTLMGQRFCHNDSGVFPKINLTENKENYILRSELPGVSSEDLKIEATGKTISISGKRSIPKREEGVKYHRREREAGQFSRIFNLEDEIDPETIEAHLKNGLLTVFIPKAEKLKPRQITIQ